MGRGWVAASTVAIAILAVGCSSSARTGARIRPVAGTSTAALRATAKGYAHSFLTGSYDDILAFLGPECRRQVEKTVDRRNAAPKLTKFRHQLQKRVGMPLDRVPMRRVAVEKASSTVFRAQVDYGLSAARVGNDNWVHYRVIDGAWKVVQVCNAPIGGISQS